MPLAVTFNYEPMIPREGSRQFWLPFLGEKTAEIYQACADLKNKPLLDLFAKDEVYGYSLDIVSRKVEETKKSITDFYARKRPDCKVEFVELPTLHRVTAARYFTPDRAMNLDITTTNALIPNVVNSLQVGRDLSVPDTGNSALNQYVDGVFKSYGLKPRFVDSTDLHIGGGNLHCSSQVVLTCAP